MTKSAGKKSLHLWLVEGIPNAPYPSPLDSPTPPPLKYLFIFRAATSLFLFKFIFTYFSHFSLGCSGMFHVPGCIDGPIFSCLLFPKKILLSKNFYCLKFNWSVLRSQKFKCYRGTPIQTLTILCLARADH